MKMHTTTAIAAIFLSLATSAASANPSVIPNVVSSDDADKTIVIKDSTRHVNVFENETVLFKSNGQQFAVKFDGARREYDLASFAPEGAVSHKVKVYIAHIPEGQEGAP